MHPWWLPFVLLYIGVAFGAAIALARWNFIDIGSDFAETEKSGKVPNAELDALRLFCREHPALVSALYVMVIAAASACWPAVLYVVWKEKKEKKK